MMRLSLADYQALIREATVLAKDRYGDKVLQLADGNILKLFRVKRWWSSANFYNYANRFAYHAQKLVALNIPTVQVIDVIKIPAVQRTAVRYRPLPGHNVRDIASQQQNQLTTQQIRDIGEFIATLHSKGIYFRSLHLGNIVFTPDQQIGLIDIADIKIQAGCLWLPKRLRNMAHLSRYAKDIELLQCGNNRFFIDAYLNTLNMHSGRSLNITLEQRLLNYLLLHHH